MCVKCETRIRQLTHLLRAVMPAAQEHAQALAAKAAGGDQNAAKIGGAVGDTLRVAKMVLDDENSPGAIGPRGCDDLRRGGGAYLGPNRLQTSNEAHVQ